MGGRCIEYRVGKLWVGEIMYGGTRWGVDCLGCWVGGIGMGLV